MKKFIPFLILTLTVVLTFCGCQNPLNYFSEEPTSTTAPTTEETTFQGNSEVVTLAKSSTEPSSSKKYNYHSDLLGATFVLPQTWENKYAVTEESNNYGGSSVTFYEKDNHSLDPSLGEIFTYNLFPTDEYKTGANFTEYGTVTIRDTTYYLVCTTPTEKKYSTKNKNMKKAYDALNKESDIKLICNSVVFDGGYPIDKNGASTTMASSSTDTTDPSATSTKKANRNSNSSGLVFPDISSRKLTSADLKGKSSDDIQTAINDICALHGYNFTTDSIKKHYQQFSWYKPSSNYSESTFNDIEKYNYSFLQKAR